MTEKKKEDITKMDFETAFTALQENVSRLESEDLSLDESLALYERGQELSKHCAKLLEEAELKVRQLADENTSPPGVVE
jgi:exodeoxyribonuclease VII small subunit